MSAKEKAEELIKKYEKEVNRFTGGQELHAKIFITQCAVICVEEIINGLTPQLYSSEQVARAAKFNLTYWSEVKSELEKL